MVVMPINSGDVSSCSDTSEVSDDLCQGRDPKDDICRDYLRNVCKRGPRCKYRHPNEQETHCLGTQVNAVEYNFCHDYQNSGCRRALCKFIHCSREEEDYYKQTGHLPSRLQQAAALGLGVLTSKYPVVQGQVPICKDFLKGECKRSSRCKFRHLTAAQYELEICASGAGLDNSSPTGQAGVTTIEQQSPRHFTPGLEPAPAVNGVTMGSIQNSNVYEVFNDLNYGQELVEFQSCATKRRRVELVTYQPLAHVTPTPLPPPTLNGYGSPAQLVATPIIGAVDYRNLEEENGMLRRKVEGLKKQVSDLAATNEVLLEQNARYRTGKPNSVSAAPPIVSVSQVVTPTITPAPTIASPQVRPPITQGATTHHQMTPVSIIFEQKTAGLIALSQAHQLPRAPPIPQPSIPQITAQPQTQPQPAIVPVSIALETMPQVTIATVSIAPREVMQQRAVTQISMAPAPVHKSIPCSQKIVGPGRNNTLVSYPLISHTPNQIPSSSLG